VGARTNASRYVDAATQFLPQTLNKQIVGMVDLFYPEEVLTATTPMPAGNTNVTHTVDFSKSNRERNSIQAQSKVLNADPEGYFNCLHFCDRSP